MRTTRPVRSVPRGAKEAVEPPYGRNRRAHRSAGRRESDTAILLPESGRSRYGRVMWPTTSTRKLWPKARFGPRLSRLQMPSASC